MAVWICKLAGAVMILGGCACMGSLKGRAALLKSRQVKSMWEYLALASSEIRLKEATLEEIIRSLCKTAKPPFREAFSDMAAALDRDGSLQDAWQAGIRKLQERTLLTEEEIRPFLELAEQPLVQEKRRQEELMEQCISRLKEKERELLEEYRKHGQVYRNLGICAGVLCIILLF